MSKRRLVATLLFAISIFPLACGGGSSTNTAAGGSSVATGGSSAAAGGSGKVGQDAGVAGAGGGGASGGTSTAAGTTTGGTSATGGTTRTGGATSPYPGVNCTAALTGSATRPQLTDASAACYTIKNYLAETGALTAPVRDNWDPSAGLPEASTLKATYTVAGDGSGTHTTVQAAIDAAMASGSSSRAYILVKPGTYRELICVKGPVPITLYGADADANAVTIAFDNYNSKPVDPAKVNACATPSATATSYGTSGSTTFFVSAADFQAMNLTIANDFEEGTLTSNIQAVALTVQGDKGVFQNVHLIGNQDTLQVKSALTTAIARSYFKNSRIEGDTDFIFGRGRAVFDGCTITYVSARKTNSTHISPSTNSNNPFGFLIINSKIVGDSKMPTGTAYLGRAWDDSSDPAANGQAVIRDSEIGGHIKVATPWTVAASTSRPFSATDNRLYEYQNGGPGAAGTSDGGVPADAAPDASGDSESGAESGVGSSDAGPSSEAGTPG